MTCPSSSQIKHANPPAVTVRAGQVRLYEDRGRFIKYFVLSYSELAGSFAPSAVCLVLDTNMGDKVFSGCQMECAWNASLFTSSKEVEL